MNGLKQLEKDYLKSQADFDFQPLFQIYMNILIRDLDFLEYKTFEKNGHVWSQFKGNKKELKNKDKATIIFEIIDIIINQMVDIKTMQAFEKSSYLEAQFEKKKDYLFAKNALNRYKKQMEKLIKHINLIKDSCKKLKIENKVYLEFQHSTITEEREEIEGSIIKQPPIIREAINLSFCLEE